MLPGFIDTHGHLTALVNFDRYVNLSSPPAGPIRDIGELQAALRRHITEQRIAPGEWVIGVGYDDSLLGEQRHPTRDDLDAVSKDHPVWIVHVSGHLSAGNSVLLGLLGLSADTADPIGGHFRRRVDSRELNGVFEEAAHYGVFARVPQPTTQALEAGIVRTLDRLAAYGLTTVQEGAANPAGMSLLQQAAAADRLDLDVIVYRSWSIVGSPFPDELPFGRYAGRLKIDGLKIILDGSPQGKTAYLSEPYFRSPEGRDAQYRGYPSLPQGAVDLAVRESLARGVTLLAHANGDAAAQMLIDAVAAAPERSSDARVVMIHAQTVRDDQLDRIAALHITPSFFIGHTFFWGDWHRDETLGPQRAQRISPLRSATDRGIRYTLHNDPPVVPPDMIRTLWSATTRRTRSGVVLGAAQRASITEALSAVTIDAARQYGEADLKGSIEPGKQADFVIVSEDPLAMDPERLLELRVLETISRGRRVFPAD